MASRRCSAAAMQGGGTLPMTPEELLEAAILIYLRGLGLPDGPPRKP